MNAPKIYQYQPTIDLFYRAPAYLGKLTKPTRWLVNWWESDVNFSGYNHNIVPCEELKHATMLEF